MIQDPTPSRPNLSLAYYTVNAPFPLWVIKLFAWTAIAEGAIAFASVFAELRELQFSTLLNTANWIYMDAIMGACGSILIFAAGVMLLSQRRIGATLITVGAGIIIVAVLINVTKVYGFSAQFASFRWTIFISRGILSAVIRILVPAILLVAMCFSDLRHALKGEPGEKTIKL